MRSLARSLSDGTGGNGFTEAATALAGNRTVDAVAAALPCKNDRLLRNCSQFRLACSERSPMVCIPSPARSLAGSLDTAGCEDRYRSNKSYQLSQSRYFIHPMRPNEAAMFGRNQEEESTDLGHALGNICARVKKLHTCRRLRTREDSLTVGPGKAIN